MFPRYRQHVSSCSTSTLITLITNDCSFLKCTSFLALVDLKLMMSSADQSAGSMFERNAAKEEKSSLKAATPGDEKISTLEMHESHLPCNVK